MIWAISYILGMTDKINERGTTWEKGNVGTKLKHKKFRIMAISINGKSLKISFKSSHFWITKI